MTGYGKAEYVENGISLTVEIKTVNNRFLDIIPKYPRAFVALDDSIRKTVQSRISRGRAELFITFSDTSEGSKKSLSTRDCAGSTFLRRKRFAKSSVWKTISR